MKTKAILKFSFLVLFLASITFTALAQTKPLLKRTTSKTDRLDFGSGGTLSIIGVPNGSIRVEGWQKNEIEISAEIEVHANSEADLERISKITGFVLEESSVRTGITSLGIHDKKYLKKVDKKFPKTLLGLPFRIDYVVKVPRYTDLEIDGGKGDLTVTGVEGVMRINYLDTNAKIDLVGGEIRATFGAGTVDVSIPTRSWRGRFADIQLATGTMNVGLPPSLNADVDASILRTGKIENSFTEFKPRVRRAEFTDKSIVAKSGTGGISLKFTVGDGTLKIAPFGKPS